ncbi:probable WRKY transcription factor 15 [Mangifera indica]|uniref:probable WRKY transcription factor 15 n=1 Tax=Mangifera indica TaxID=29780 RepID=UPI001CFB59F5|nr:probable WRKY transcription factor 15 [Mangifera indica]
MAVELMMGFGKIGFSSKMKEESAVKEAASGLEGVEKLLKLLSSQQHNREKFSLQSSSSSTLSLKSPMDLDKDYKAVADVTVSKFKRVISLLGRTRTGHARFRRAPVASPHHLHHHENSYLVVPKSRVLERKDSSTTISFSYSSAANSFISSLTGVCDSKQHPSSSSAFQITNLSHVSSVGKPPLSSSALKRKCNSENNVGSARKCGVSSGRCHCSKKKKLRLKRVVRIPAVSLKLSDIPPDDYSWRKYGQKPIEGSPHPRGYYKCSSERGCPARKHVERVVEDPSMLVVTYEGEHSHSLSVADAAKLILES